MRRHLTALIIAPALLTGCQMPFTKDFRPSLNQQLAMYSKPSVVRIGAGCQGTYKYKLPKGEQKEYDLSTFNIGTGYFINPKGYILTNAHVVDYAKNNGETCKKQLFNNLIYKLGYNPSVISKEKRSEIEKNYVFPDDFELVHRVLLPQGDKFDFEIKHSGTPVGGDSKDIAVIKIEVKDAPVIKLGDSDTVNIQDDVIVIGYPGAADANNDLDLKSMLEASVTDGKVSNTNKKLKGNAPVLQINVQVAPGSSGSPVIDNQGKVVGILTFAYRDKSGGSFIPFAIPTNTIQEFIRQSGATNETSLTDDLYHQGLDFYWKGDYQGAKTKFDAVKELFPQHSEINRLIRDSQQKLAENWEKSNYVPWLLAICGFIAGTIVVFLFVHFGRRSYNSTRLMPDVGPTSVEASSEMEQESENQPSRSVLNRISNILQLRTVVSTQAYIELKNSQGDVHKLYLQKDTHKIGRDRKWSDIEIPDDGWEVVSRHHARLRKEGDSYRIYDGDGVTPSTNQILINGTPIDPQAGHLLKDEDQLTIGRDPHNQVVLTYFSPVNKQSVV